MHSSLYLILEGFFCLHLSPQSDLEWIIARTDLGVLYRFETAGCFALPSMSSSWSGLGIFFCQFRSNSSGNAIRLPRWLKMQQRKNCFIGQTDDVYVSRNQIVCAGPNMASCMCMPRRGGWHHHSKPQPRQTSGLHKTLKALDLRLKGAHAAI